MFLNFILWNVYIFWSLKMHVLCKSQEKYYFSKQTIKPTSNNVLQT